MNRNDDVILSINLTQCDMFTPQRTSTCNLTFHESKFLDFDSKISTLISNGVPLPTASFSEELVQFLFGKKTIGISSYQPTLFLQRLLTLSIIDVITNLGSTNQFTVSVVKAMDFSPTQSIFKPEMIINSLVDVIIEVFGDVCLWEESKDPLSIPQFHAFVGLLAAAVARSENSAKCIRFAIDKFCPSSFGDAFLMLFVEKLQLRLDSSNCFRVLSDVFGDFWFIKSFRNRQLLTYFILSKNNVTILPYVAVYCLVAGWALDGHDAKSAAISISQIGGSSLFISKRLAKAVVYPILDAIYSQPFSSDLPYLEMTEEQLKSVNNKLENAMPILKATIFIDRRVQLATLNCICNFIGKHNFEPKGLLLAIFSFLSESCVIHPSVFNCWMQQETDMQPKFDAFSQTGYGIVQRDANDYVDEDSDELEYKFSALLEVNSLLMTLIPGAFPTHTRSEGQKKAAAAKGEKHSNDKEKEKEKEQQPQANEGKAEAPKK